MELAKGFIMIVMNMIGELWMGFYRRNSDFYDKQTSGAKSKLGYYAFIIVAAAVTVGIVSWMYSRVYS
ncbi:MULTISPECIES: hypothetical protein [unclassified Paenibacillus]|uniref:hypothetical protein n=1 Tax=unclassified Paenibacillus TaxID=185978 RepID=UPI0003FD03D6|nr:MULTISPECIES: hypothetical protein [unclassified Paenibacillus]KGP80508.1 hypothetical protein P364_0119360 [Paenibacillus sp. MAEPY2]KGP86443.1 hypothetical protein P363_0117770 [Paenibacillus sp. MAEPY1]